MARHPRRRFAIPGILRFRLGRSARALRVVAASTILVLASGSWAVARAGEGDLLRGEQCLASNDLPCAREILDQGLAHDPSLEALRTDLLFYEGKYDLALGLLDTLRTTAGNEDAYQAKRRLFTDTVEATRRFRELRRGDIIVRYAPGPDEVLLDDAFDVVSEARRVTREALGGDLPEDAVLEIYPTGHDFTLASSLGAKAVQTTHVLALSKWARLLVTSPRALSRGYAWKDTITHEYIHEVVSYRTHDLAPVWLQEGIARHLDSWWRGDRTHTLLPYAQSLVAEAIASNNLVTFEEMHPSMAFLPTAERATLAFAEVKVFVEFALAKGGDGTLIRTLDAVRDGKDARLSLAQAAGYPDFASFEADALDYLKSLDLVSSKLRALPAVVDGSSADDFASDPLFSERKDLADFARLGDLLREAGRVKAALVEYAKATPTDEPEGPMLANRIALCHVLLGDRGLALEELKASARDYPEFAATWKSIGEIELAMGRHDDALSAYRSAADINPFDPDVQSQMSLLFSQAGNTVEASKHAKYQRILLTGGATVTP
jgi:tetratricopeptide (TPR) repeat protein